MRFPMDSVQPQVFLLKQQNVFLPLESHGVTIILTNATGLAVLLLLLQSAGNCSLPFCMVPEKFTNNIARNFQTVA